VIDLTNWCDRSNCEHVIDLTNWCDRSNGEHVIDLTNWCDRSNGEHVIDLTNWCDRSNGEHVIDLTNWCDRSNCEHVIDLTDVIDLTVNMTIDLTDVIDLTVNMWSICTCNERTWKFRQFIANVIAVYDNRRLEIGYCHETPFTYEEDYVDKNQGASCQSISKSSARSHLCLT